MVLVVLAGGEDLAFAEAEIKYVFTLTYALVVLHSSPLAFLFYRINISLPRTKTFPINSPSYVPQRCHPRQSLIPWPFVNIHLPSSLLPSFMLAILPSCGCRWLRRG